MDKRINSFNLLQTISKKDITGAVTVFEAICIEDGLSTEFICDAPDIIFPKERIILFL